MFNISSAKPASSPCRAATNNKRSCWTTSGSNASAVVVWDGRRTAPPDRACRKRRSAPLRGVERGPTTAGRGLCRGRLGCRRSGTGVCLGVAGKPTARPHPTRPYGLARPSGSKRNPLQSQGRLNTKKEKPAHDRRQKAAPIHAVPRRPTRWQALPP